MRVRRISLPLSNAFLVSDKKHILVDAGRHGDHSNLITQIELSGVSGSDIAAVVLTHVHFDHCGCAAAFQEAGIPIIAAASSAESLRTGLAEGHSVLDRAPQIIRSSKLFRKLQRGFPPVQVDYPVREDCSLSEFGVDGRVVLTPGHTDGSLSVCLSDGSACVGDLLMGGFLGLPPAWRPAIHPCSTNQSGCYRQIRTLREMGYERFFVGHGDTLEASAVDDFLEQNLRP